MPDIQFSLTGLESLQAKLDSVNQDMKKRGGRFALRKAANVLANKVKANAQRIDDPRSREEIAKNVAVRWDGKRFRRFGELSFRVGILGGARNYANSRENRRKRRAGQAYQTGGSSSNPGGDTWYWRLVEFGTSRTRAKPFMRPAADQSVDAMTNEFITQYDKALGRAIKRASRGG